MTDDSTVAERSDAGPYSLDGPRTTGVVFVHVPKTGGTSVARALYGTAGIGPRTAANLRAALGETGWAQTLSFAVVRDPADRVASAFRYLKAGGSNALDAAFRDRALGPFSTVDSFVEGWLTEESSRSQVHFWPQTDFVLDGRGAFGREGAVLVDRLVRYDALAQGYAAIRRATGVGGPLPRLNVGPRRAPVPLGAKAAARVRSVYAADYALLRSLA